MPLFNLIVFISSTVITVLTLDVFWLLFVNCIFTVNVKIKIIKMGLNWLNIMRFERIDFSENSEKFPMKTLPVWYSKGGTVYFTRVYISTSMFFSLLNFSGRSFKCLTDGGGSKAYIKSTDSNICLNEPRDYTPVS